MDTERTITDTERTKTAFKAAQDQIKQILTLSTAIITLLIAFGDGLQRLEGWVIPLSAALFLFSIGAGLGALGKLTGLLADKASILAPDSINEAKGPAQFQMLFFFLGLAVSAISFVISGVSNL